MSGSYRRRADLLRLLDGHSFDSALIATFDFDPDFFERFCLDDLRAFASNGNITILLDQGAYEEMLARPPTDRPEKANLRYLLHPVRVPGAFHPKVILCTSATRGLLLVGSANLTRQGLTANAELVSAFEFEDKKKELFKPMFGRALSFFRDLSTFSPSENLQSNIDEAVARAPWLEGSDSQGLEALGLVLVDSLKASLWDQVTARLCADVTRVHVLSPFFDNEPDLLDRVLEDLDPGEVLIYTQNGTTTLTEKWLDHSSVCSGRTSIRLCDYRDENHQQRLHGKILAFEHKDKAVLAYGSANFTSAALLSSHAQRNIEAVIVTSPLPTSEINLPSLFDPEGTGVLLRARNQLQTAPPSTKEIITWEPTAFRLVEAEFVEGVVDLRVSVADRLSLATLIAILVTGDGARIELRLTRKRADSWSGELKAGHVARVSHQATSVRVVGKTEEGLEVSSNEVFLINLQDPVTGTATRRDRRLREAENSAAQFAGVLSELLKSGDERALLLFLNYCDIPLLEAPRPQAARLARDPNAGLAELRRQGEQNRRFLEVVHEAALEFVDRHLRRLERNAASPALRSAASFMHIARSTGEVLRSQLVRVAVGLTASTTPLSPAEWASLRTKVDQYLQRARQLVELVGQRFVPALGSYYEEPAIAEEIRPDLSPFSDFLAALVETTESIRAAAHGAVRVRAPSGALVEPPFVDGNILAGKQWSRFQSHLRTSIEPFTALAGALKDS